MFGSHDDKALKLKVSVSCAVKPKGVLIKANTLACRTFHNTSADPGKVLG